MGTKRYGNRCGVRGLIRLDDIEILNQYNAEVRGMYNYYRLANNATVLNSFLYVMKFSMYKTFAGKYRTSMRKIIRKYCRNGDFYCIVFNEKRDKICGVFTIRACVITTKSL